MTFDFNIDAAWNEIMYLWRMVRGWTFSFTTYDMNLVNGQWVSTPVVNQIHILDFVCAFLVATTLMDVLFWWKKAENGELDED